MAPLFDWPWKCLGTYKYYLYLPIFANAIYAHFQGVPNFCFHIIIISALRYVQYQCWTSFSRLHCLVKRHQIHANKIGFEQVDREFDSDNLIIFQALVATIVHTCFRSLSTPVTWNSTGILYLILFHVGATEPLYYWVHRALHEGPLFSLYHSFHHASVVPEPATAGTHTFFEQLLQAGMMALPLTGATLMGGTCLSLWYVYPLVFDFFKQMGHYNCEIVPLWLFRMFPPLRYLLYTPSYHALHHTEMNSNFCLFMPLFDYMGGTVHKNTVELYLCSRKDKRERIPDFVFLVHCIDVMSSLHVPFSGRTASSMSFRSRWYVCLASPLGLVALFCLWAWGKTFVATEYLIRGLHAQSWIIPRYGFHYFLPFCTKRINELIEQAILDADAMGVKVINLAALNKNESLNGGGMMFVNKHKHLNVRVVHGNTLTTALVLKELPATTSEVFLTGATSKIGRAIALYLCRKNIRVLMLTSSRERYLSILNEASADHRHNLIQVTKYQAGQNCKRWIVGKWASRRDQTWAPPGTHFHQFVVPCIYECRKDCTYGKLAGMKLPEGVKGMYSCEYTFDRGVVAACHAGGLLHALENWEHHEVGTIPVDRIDIVWESALKNGFTSV